MVFASRSRRRAQRIAAARRPWEIWAWVAAATLVAAVLRFYEIGTWSFWIDEAHTYRDATMPLDGDNGFWTQDRSLYPLTFLGLRWLLDAQWLGTEEGSLRVPFAIVGIATVPMMWLYGRQLVGVGAAVFSAWLLAVMPWHIYWSQNARGYVFVVLAAVIATAKVWQWSEDGRKRDLVSGLLAIGLGTAFHPTASLQLTGVVAFMLLRRRKLRSRSVLIAVAIGAVVLALVPFAMRLSPFRAFQDANANASIVHLAATAGYFFRPLLIVSALAGYFLVRRRHGHERALLLLCLTVMPALVLAAVGTTVAQTTARYAICVLPPLLWLGAAAAGELAALAPIGRSIAVRAAAAFLGFALLADFGQGTWQYYFNSYGDRARWREACHFVADRFGDGRVHALTVNEPTVTYYLDRDYWANGQITGQVQIRVMADWLLAGIRSDGKQMHPPGAAHHLAWQLQQARKRNAKLIVLVTLPELREIDSDGSLWATLRSEFELVLHLPCWVGPKDESIYVFVPSGA